MYVIEKHQQVRLAVGAERRYNGDTMARNAPQRAPSTGRRHRRGNVVSDHRVTSKQLDPVDGRVVVNIYKGVCKHSSTQVQRILYSRRQTHARARERERIQESNEPRYAGLHYFYINTQGVVIV